MTFLRTPIIRRHDCELTLGQALATLATLPVLWAMLAAVLALGAA
jgi:hypothetical protein